MPRTTAPYGSWKSPITSSLLTSAGIYLSQIAVTPEGVYWTEGRPLEGGRVVIVRDGQDITPAGFNVRTRVHEYGGGAYTADRNRVFFSNFTDQRLYRQDGVSSPRPLTPEPPSAGSLRYADACVSPDGEILVCVRERHEAGREAINELVTLPTDGSREPRIIAAGHDFYSSPRFSPDGERLLWLTWDHPDMPWDATTLWLDGSQIAGGSSESIFQPEWSPSGRSGMVHYISDKTGWWNLYADDTPLCPMDAEFGAPQWVFKMSRYVFLSGNRIACVYSRNGLDYLAILDTGGGSLNSLQLPFSSYSDLQTDGADRLFFIAASAASAPQVLALDLRDSGLRVLKSSMETQLDSGDVSTPEPIEFPTTRGRSAYALFYPPANNDQTGSQGERPPLLVMSHGGPTSAATSSLRLSLQYWTSRGFAVVDVNYGGSSGYGRAYRERLNGEWGIVDVEDCIHAARYLASRDAVDPRRMAIRGGSAGGYTTLCALVFHDVFAAGASHYGVGDLAALAQDTHKFESRYTDRLVAPYPAGEEIYRQRSPIHFADRIGCPVILFQGLDDKVVPPNQAETFIAALRAKGLPFAYLAFPEEGHGFRKAQTIQRVAEAELLFYSQVFGFVPADPIEPILIEGFAR